MEEASGSPCDSVPSTSSTILSQNASEVDWDPVEYEGRKVVVRVDEQGEPCLLESGVRSSLAALHFVCWRSFDESNHREYAECVEWPMTSREVHVWEIADRRLSRTKVLTIPSQSVYFINPEKASAVGLDPHPDQDSFFPDLIRDVPGPISSPHRITSPFPSDSRVFVPTRGSGRISVKSIRKSPVLGTGIELRESRIPSSGRGVFAARDFLQNELVTLYFGHVFGEAHRIHMQAAQVGSHCKSLQFKHSYLDGVKVAFSGMPAGQLLNQGGKKTVNCDFTNLEIHPGSGEKLVGIRALRDIFPGEELYVNYGLKFWSEQGLVPADPPPVKLPARRSFLRRELGLSEAHDALLPVKKRKASLLAQERIAPP